MKLCGTICDASGIKPNFLKKCINANLAFLAFHMLFTIHIKNQLVTHKLSTFQYRNCSLYITQSMCQVNTELDEANLSALCKLANEQPICSSGSTMYQSTSFTESRKFLEKLHHWTISNAHSCISLWTCERTYWPKYYIQSMHGPATKGFLNVQTNTQYTLQVTHITKTALIIYNTSMSLLQYINLPEFRYTRQVRLYYIISAGTRIQYKN